MRILIDPVYTNPAHKCASAIKFRKIVAHLLATTDDIFFYWIKHTSDSFVEDCPEEWWIKSDRIAYETIPYCSDRYREFYRLRPEYEELISRMGKWWDTDIHLTNRGPLVPLIRQHSCDPRSSGGYANLRTIIVLEDMPMFQYKTKALVMGEYSEMACLHGYMQADHVILNDFWQRKHLLDAAGVYCSPAIRMQLAAKIENCSPVLVDNFALKTKEFVVAQHKHEKEFVISFSGRMINAHHLEEIFELMMKHFALKSDVKCLVTTQSLGTGRVRMEDYRFVEVIKADRDTFWDIVKNRSSVGVFFSEDQDYSLSVLEPIILGLPVLLYECEWALKSVGENYPFYFSNMKQAYVHIQSFYKDYAGTYKKFAEWYRAEFEPLMKGRNDVYLPYRMADLIREIQEKKKQIHRMGEFDSGMYRLAMKKKGPFDFLTLLKECDNEGLSSSMKSWIRGFEINSKLRWAMFPVIHSMRQGLLNNGFVDASTTPGLLVKKS